MFMVFSKDKIISYLVSIGTVALLFVISFAMTKNNEEIIKTVPLEINNSTLTKYIPFCNLLSNTMEVGMFLTNNLSPYGEYYMDIFVTLQKTNIIDGIIQE